ncbi:hypothetical protein AX15_007016 [Amanita polypyramis BW_CC]|nr:hypothetical protein AX15_007016 [Amanita polypyramis BW_CC]
MKRQVHVPNNEQKSPRKRAKLASPQVVQKFTNVEPIRVALGGSQNPEALIRDLTSLRNQLTVKHNESSSPISPDDGRLLLVQQWLENDTGAKDVFDIWEKANPKNTILHVLIVSLLSTVLSLVSSHFTYHAAGYPVLKALLTPPCIRRLNSYLGGSSNELILVSLKLYNVMSMFGGGKERRTVLDSFPWELKSLPKLLNMRRRGKVEEADPFVRPDIRTLYISFLLSFIHQDSSSHIKSLFLEQHRHTLPAVFKGISQDPYGLAKEILEVCWSGLWSDPKVKRTLKIGLFNEVTIGHLLKLYERDKSEDEDPGRVPADLVHHFLLAICTRPGVGICFKDHGWYPREQDADEKVINDNPEFLPQKSKIYNKILSNILRTLKVNEDPRQQELAVKIMSACPELVAGYWSAAALTLEPRLSSRWLANVAFFGTIISHPIPSPSFLLLDDAKGTYQPTPPPLQIVLENVLPSVNTKLNFSKGLQSTSPLVQHCTALALIKCLMKYDQILQVFRDIATALEEDEEEGQWFKRVRDLEKEVRRRVPEFQVVVAFSQHVSVHGTSAPPHTQNAGQPVAPNTTRTALLSESAQRLLWMYHRCLPALVAEARFDVGKLLQGFTKITSDEEDEEVLDAGKRLDRVRRLHVLRLLKESDQFAWTGKLPGSSHSYLHVLLRSFTTTDIAAECSALNGLLQHILCQTILFQEDIDEPSLWLSSLPTIRRSLSGSISPDGAMLTDEAESVITFLDDCVQRCLKTPYRYIEELQTLIKDTSASRSAPLTDHLAYYPSPLLATVIEQLNVKVGNKLLSPSDVLSLASFVRKLVVNLAMKVSNLALLQSVAKRLDEILSVDRLFPDYSTLTAAVRREMRVLTSCLSRLARNSSELRDLDGTVSISEEVAGFLREVAQLSPPSSPIARAYAAYELVDWVRLVEEPIGCDEVNCIIDVVKDFCPPALSAVVAHLDPTEHTIWEAIDVEEYLMNFPGSISFQQLYLHADEPVLLDEEPRAVISRTLARSSSLLDIKRAIRMITHGLTLAASLQDEFCSALVLLLAEIVEDVSHTLSAADLEALKEELFVHEGNLKSLCVMREIPIATKDALERLVRVSLAPVSERNKTIASDICTFWLNTIKSNIGSGEIEMLTGAIWINYFPILDLLGLLDDLTHSAEEMPSQSCIGLLNSVLSALRVNVASDVSIRVHLGRRLPLLFSLLEILQDKEVLENLIATAIGDSLPLYSESRLAADDVDSSSLSSIIQLSEHRWLHAREPLPREAVAQKFLVQERWTASTVKILRALSYRRSISQESFTAWLETDQCKERALEERLPIINAFLDSAYADGGEIRGSNADIFVSQFQPLAEVVLDENAPPQQRLMASNCAKLIMKLIPSKTIPQISNLVESSNFRTLTPDIFSLALWTCRKAPDDARLLVTVLVERGLRWLIGRLGDDGYLTDMTKDMIQRLISLVKVAKDVKAQYLETLLGVVIQSHLKDREIVRLATSALSCAHLKPLIVNRHLQSILQHPQFHKLCVVSGNSETRDAIVDLLHALFHLHPSNTCQVTHVEPLINVYRATVSPSDLKLFSIFQLFEEERKLSTAKLFGRWSTNPSALSSNYLEAIQSLDPSTVMRTCLHFPKWRRLEDQSRRSIENHDAQLYDPVFLILMFGDMLSENPPTSAFAWVEMFRTNIVGLLIRSLSSKDAQIRDLSLCNLAALWKSLQVADMFEKPHVLYIINLLKDTFTQPIEDVPRRLPSYTTLVLLHALRGVFYPSNFIYPLTARFLLQRPELDTHDVPMLYGMLYSSSDDWKKERGWIIRMLADGMMSTDDWRVLKRRHTWDLLASLFQSSYGDHSLRKGILEVLANLTCNIQATRSLILRSSLLTWIQMQLRSSSNREDLAWAKILANIVFLGDAEGLEASTNGEWRVTICYCLSILLDPKRCSDAPNLLRVISPTTLKMSGMPNPPGSELSILLENAVKILATIEGKINLSSATQDVHDKEFILPPYTAGTLHDEQERNLLSTWGRSVEMLWQVSMSFNYRPPGWEALTIRILKWRSIVGADQSHVGEWVRISVLQNIGNIQ